MNKKIIGLSMIAALMATASIANAASTGTITFNGEVTDSTCDVSVNGGDANGTVGLPKTPVSALKSGGAVGRTAFNLELTNCALSADSGETMVSAFFQSGKTVDTETGRLNNMATGDTAAKSVQLVLMDMTSNKGIWVGNEDQQTNAGWVTVETGTGTKTVLPYSVAYIQEAGQDATAGLVTSSVIYNLQYK